MTDARCVPPDGAEDGSWWWLKRGADEKPARWGSTWEIEGDRRFSWDLYAEGWRLASPHPIPSPPELARLWEIEEAATKLHGWLHMKAVPDHDLVLAAAVRDLTAALAKEPSA